METSFSRVQSGIFGVFLVIIAGNAFLIACGDNKKKNVEKSEATKTQTSTGKGNPSSGDAKEQEASAGENPSGFLKESNFPTEKSAISAKLIKRVLDQHLSVKQLDGEKLDSKEEDESDNDKSGKECEKKVAKIVKVSPEAIRLDSDSITCNLDNGSGGTIKMTQKIKGQLTCSKKAFQKFPPEGIFTTPVQELCQDGVLKYFSNTQVSFKGGGMDSKETQAVMTVKGAPCQYSIKNSEITVEDGCWLFQQNESVDDELGKVTIKAEYKSVKGNLKKKFYTSGSMDVTINTWKGTIKFGSGTPTFSFKSEKGEKVSGNWSEFESKNGASASDEE